MKYLMKLLSLLLVLTFILTSLIACGGSKDTEAASTESETQAQTQETEEKETQFDRNSVKDDIPTDLNFSPRTAKWKTMPIFKMR